METTSMTGNHAVISPSEAPAALRYVARQPILDLRSRVHGYELLFRSGPEAAFRGDGNAATRTMIDNVVMFGLEKLTGGVPGFVNCTLEALTERLVEALPPSMTVLEILENIKPTPHLVESCRKLKTLGFRIALDDFTWRPDLAPLVAMADYVKIDFMISPAADRKTMLRHLTGRPLARLAEKVETQEDYRTAQAEGFTLFQGYFFCRPMLLEKRDIPANRLFQLELLQLLHEEPLNIEKVSELVKRDAALTYRLLRLVNSPACAVRHEVRSVQAALIMVGDATFRRVATLAIASEFASQKPPEILRMAFIRARFCELAASLCGLDPKEQYLLGLFSLLPAMLQMSMEDLAPSFPLRKEICGALLGQHNADRQLLNWMELSERGEWNLCTAAAAEWNVDEDHLADIAIEAVLWAEETLQTATKQI
jgi:EAL and modified HD-GYP domain-containing signal transduction protein